MMKLFTEAADISSAIERIAKQGRALDKAIHKTACSIVAHMTEHRNKTLVIDLIGAMPMSSRRKALIDWFERGMPIDIDYKSAEVDMPKKVSEEWQEYLARADETLEAMIASPFWDKAETGAKDKLSMDAVLKYLARKANAKDIDPDLAAKLTQISEFAIEVAAEGGTEGDTE
jgi:hypothetical protein